MLKISVTQTAIMVIGIALSAIVNPFCKEDVPQADTGLNQELNFSEQEYNARFKESLLKEDLFILHNIRCCNTMTL